MDLMHKTLKIGIVTPKTAFYLEEVHMIVMPGAKGELGVMPGHVPLVVGLQPGLVITYNIKMEKVDKIFITDGFAEITGNSVNILAEEANYLTDYDKFDIENKLAKAEEELGFNKNEEELELIRKSIQIWEALLLLLKDQGAA
jgi:F-type H+-transporting ATPase subunit epsilon